MLSTPNNRNTCCVVVTFHPDPALPDRLSPIIRQVDRLLIVDNGSSDSADTIFNILAADTRIEIIRNKENLGLGVALNQGVQWAGEHGYKWLLTMDQDTVARDGLIAGFTAAYEDYPEKEIIALIGANYIDRSLGDAIFKGDNSRKRYAEVIAVITSGCLVLLNAAQVIGPFREDFFIDRVDFEYCLRAQSKGMKVLLTEKPLMEHGIGTPIMRKIFGKRLLTPNSTPERHYYISRNHIVMMKQYMSSNPEWIKQSLITRTKEIILMLLLEKNRPRKLWMVFRGTIDGLRGHMGILH
ncbi:MAG: glycosyltransferase family 2 protein [Armatimonadota bacterium]